MSGSMATGSGAAAVITGIMAIGQGREPGVAGRRVIGTIRPEVITGIAGTGDRNKTAIALRASRVPGYEAHKSQRELCINRSLRRHAVGFFLWAMTMGHVRKKKKFNVLIK